MPDRFTIILAAGQGTRMKSDLYKVLHPVCGKPMVDHVLTQVEMIEPTEVVTIIGHGAQKVEAVLGDRTQYAFQEAQLGTGHAVLQAEQILGDRTGVTLVVSGDTPLFTAETFKKLFQFHEEKHAQATVLTALAPDPTGYGRIVRNELGNVERIVEQKDANSQEADIHEISTGVFCFDNQTLFKALHQVKNENAQHEYYLPDVIEIIRHQGGVVSAYQMAEFEESMGVNDRVALSKATKIMQQRINEAHMRDGVTIIDPASTYIDSDITIGRDSVIEPGVQLQGHTTIGAHCVIGAHSKIVDSTIEDQVTVTASTIEQSIMHQGSDIGPNSHLRPQSEVGAAAHIGNFCELKKASIGARTKVGHLSYVGDATLGSDINVGCGVVFVNYDGVQKFHTTVGDHAFLGSNSNIIAPVHIADHSFIAAGSTITNDIPKHAMAIARSRQTNKEDYWRKLPLANSEDWK
ncbi:bifunctional UDP-N-acetylglucosamine diphosphorylase/glucosamine-1-phosphate N-acetyltransferase GlmU [Agrilactobacillus fermenti]|uniref:bifunctional UDP-N-acetylglucosamine diphosphorylase/glucosamine-1-phosphate N-acetyltransferase GlmU n=1 Tax=Agrilactobacillus fermenti TaxID=2586909 RepID=UPI001E5B635E|nr:bifunctional UDP-N-acetylglucosamine diphosphorylase/glucosamine-1-phosphate N-acetyltransferase GlmU [Agrilactobacillus fermenti]MCD2255981.1 bifunctional UDP-N-acetylglucosamine diphosphorylase/glucosamine-1-phosphate N-acetyltransferase GlmU [Agrilactobacillus fermenti]